MNSINTIEVLKSTGKPMLLNLNNPIVARACLNVENAKIFSTLPDTVTERSKTREKIRRRSERQKNKK